MHLGVSDCFSLQDTLWPVAYSAGFAAETSHVVQLMSGNFFFFSIHSRILIYVSTARGRNVCVCVCMCTLFLLIYLMLMCCWTLPLKEAPSYRQDCRWFFPAPYKTSLTRYVQAKLSDDLLPSCLQGLPPPFTATATLKTSRWPWETPLFEKQRSLRIKLAYLINIRRPLQCWCIYATCRKWGPSGYTSWGSWIQSLPQPPTFLLFIVVVRFFTGRGYKLNPRQKVSGTAVTDGRGQRNNTTECRIFPDHSDVWDLQEKSQSTNSSYKSIFFILSI